MKPKSKIKFLSAILTVHLASLVGLVQTVPSLSCSAGSKRFCRSGQFYPDYDYRYIEGSVPLGMLAVFYIENS